MVLSDRPYTFDRVTRLIMMAGLVWGLIWLAGYLSDVLIPFAAALLLAYLLNPLVGLIQKGIPNRPLAVIVALILVLTLVGLVAWLVIPMVVSEVAHMGRLLSDLVTNSKLAKQAAERLPADIWTTLREVASRPEVKEFFNPEKLWTVAQTLANKVLPGVWGLISGAVSMLMGVFGLATVGLYLVFLLLDYPKVTDRWSGLIPPAYREPITGFTTDANRAMSTYFRAQALVAGLVGVLFAIGFSILGMPLGILLGLTIGLLNMVPYLQLAALPPAFGLATIHALETGQGFVLALGLVVLVFVAVQAIQDAILVPKIMGQATGLSPAIILLSLSIWGKLLGLLGLLIAIPMTCLIWAYYQRLTGAGFDSEEEPAEVK